MRDEIFDRDYQAGRNELHDGIDRLISTTARTFRLIAAIQFRAPWIASHPATRSQAGSV